MILTGTEDLRVQRTIESIYQAFEQLICEKEYEQIRVTELCARARISKKTFYVYYTDLNDLLTEQGQLSKAYAQRVADYQLPCDAAQVIREFFLFSAAQGEAYDRITCSEAFQYIRGQMIRNVREETNIHPFTSTLHGVYMSTALLEIYKYWVTHDRSQPIKEVIAEATALICHGLDGLQR